MAKNDTTNAQRVAIDHAYAATVKLATSILHHIRNFGYALSTAFKRAIKFIKADDKRVRFARKSTVTTYNEESKAVIITYDSGADSNYISQWPVSGSQCRARVWYPQWYGQWPWRSMS